MSRGACRAARTAGACVVAVRVAVKIVRLDALLAEAAGDDLRHRRGQQRGKQCDSFADRPQPGSPRRWSTTALTCVAASVIVGAAVVTSRLAGPEAAGAVAAFPTMCTILTLAVVTRTAGGRAPMPVPTSCAAFPAIWRTASSSPTRRLRPARQLSRSDCWPVGPQQAHLARRTGCAETALRTMEFPRTFL